MAEKSFEITLTGGEGYRFTVDFDDPELASLLLDEPEPVGDGEGPNATRLLAAAVGNCLSASLLHCLKKARVEPTGFRTVVKTDVVRNEGGRLRVGGIDVRLHPEVTEEGRDRMKRCLDLFEDFCIVTASVRAGIDVEVEVVPETKGESA